VNLPRLARLPLAAVALGVVALLVATINRYGYHRDELYFRLLADHPAWGYVDQPPLTPMLAKVSIAVFGDHLWSIRLVPILCAVAIVVLAALLARECQGLGGGTGAQVLAAAGTCSTLVLVAGHLLFTGSVDLVAWLLAILFAVRALRRDQPRWWLAAGLAVGLGLYNKQLIVLLLIGLGAGLLIGGPRRALLSPCLWAGVGIALLVGAPNLVYQIANDWPQAKMAAALSENKGGEARVLFVPMQLVLLGPLLVPVWVAGWVHLFRTPAVRAFAWAYPVVCVVVLVTGGQSYYPFGLLILLYATGCVVAARWAASRGRRVLLGAAVAVSVAISVLLALPVWPVRSLPAPIAALNPADRDSVGWPAYVRQVADVYHALPDTDRAVAVLVAGNYGEAGALARYGPAYGLPTVYSGQNELYRFGPPPDSATVVVFVGTSRVTGLFDSCATVARLDNGVGVDNEEQGRPVLVCRYPHRPWHEMWPGFQHYD
jgi:4-amino-4-deoxy-L-arabinose transferase-like glycosyltransferase